MCDPTRPPPAETSSKTNTTTITSATDDISNRWHVESLLQKLSRLTGDHHRPHMAPFYPVLFPATCQPLPGESIEITGTHSSGKTRLIFELIAETILPIEYGGHSAHVCYIESKLDNNRIHLLAAILDRQIRQHHRYSGVTTNTEKIIAKSMERLILFRCPTRASQTITISNLDAILLHDVRYSLIVLDSVATYYWLAAANVAPQNQYLRIERYVSDLMGSIGKVARQHGLLLIYGRPKEFVSTVPVRQQGSNRAAESPSWRPDYVVEVIDRSGGNDDGESATIQIREALLMCEKQRARFRKEFTINQGGLEWM